MSKIDDADVIGLVCGRVSEDLRPHLVPGTAERTADCGHEVFIAPSTLKLLESREPGTAKVTCLPCFGDKEAMEKAMDERNAYMVPGQEEELRGSLGPTVTREILARLEKD